MAKRIIILGGGGSGKSTLANRIGSYFNYPVYHLDSLFLNTDYRKKDLGEIEKISEIFMEKDCAVVEGNYRDTLRERVEWADTIIFIDIPTYMQYYRVFKRMLLTNLKIQKRYGKVDGAKNIVQWNFIKWIYGWNKEYKKMTLEIINSLPGKNVMIINRPNRLDLNTLK